MPFSRVLPSRSIAWFVAGQVGTYVIKSTNENMVGFAIGLFVKNIDGNDVCKRVQCLSQRVRNGIQSKAWVRTVGCQPVRKKAASCHQVSGVFVSTAAACAGASICEPCPSEQPRQSIE